MKESSFTFHKRRLCRQFLAVTALLTVASIAATAQSLVFQLDPQRTAVNFTVADALHTVRGTFGLKQGSMRLDPASGKLTGEFVVDAKSGASGSGMRDRKMHREVLESDRYPEIVFHPDRVEGTVLPQGKSSVQNPRNVQHPRSGP
jgi:polyisoprenoid-binding protein YceI